MPGEAGEQFSRRGEKQRRFDYPKKVAVPAARAAPAAGRRHFPVQLTREALGTLRNTPINRCFD